jgi:predicted RNA-binding Zn ribbon-like protein
MLARPHPTSAPLLGEALPIDLMNTIWADRHGGHDALASEDDVAAWLRAVDLGGPTWSAAQTIARESGEHLRVLRDAFRRLASSVTRDPRDRGQSEVSERASAVEILNQATRSAPTWPELVWASGRPPRLVQRSAQSAGPRAVALIARAGVELFAGPARVELRACLAPGCVLYFLADHPRREWCSTACGNRARAARHYSRHRVGQVGQLGQDNPTI